jgi:serine/threonine-protein kinase
MIGREIDQRYRIEAELGHGGAGTVYRAVSLADGRPVAIKVLKAEVGSSTEQRLRFEREARALAQLSHPGIVAVLDSGVFEGTPYLVMELLGGETLADRIRRGPLPLEAAIRVLEQLLRALAYVHDQGLVHRDVKPGNIFLVTTAEGQMEVRLLDFGLARFLSPEAGDRLVTRAGQVFGTPAYMAPEQIAGQEADARVDVYASGIVLFEMLAGKPPFEGDTSEVLRQQVVEDLPLHDIPSQVALPWVVELLARAAAKTRPERFKDAGEMLAALEARPRADSAADGTLDPTLEETLEHVPEAPRGPLSRAARLVTNLVTLVVVLVSAGALVAAALAAYVLTAKEREAERRWLESRLGLSPNPPPASSSSTDEPTAAPSTSSMVAGAPAQAGRSGPGGGGAAPAGSAPPPAASSPRPPAANPWATVPAELGRYLTKVNRGRALEKRELAKVHQYNGKHPGDPRGHLLLARSHLRRRWVKDATSELAIAYKLDPGARGDPRLLPDLLTLVQLGSVDAPRLVGEIFGKEAIPALEALLSRPAPRSGTTAAIERGRLEKLLGALSAAPGMQ